jgi:HEAT repeat protein
MTDLKTAQDMMAAAVAAKGTEEPEIASVKRVLKLLDKTAKSNRTYGATNPVAIKFSQQLFEELSGHLSSYTILTFLVQRSELFCHDTQVYQAETEGASENLAFKLYSDGIRDLAFHAGLTQDDMMFFLDSLWAGQDPTQDDDDIVTRLWSKNLSTISIVTAEEIAKMSVGTDPAALQTAEMNSSDSTLREMLDRERRNNNGGDAVAQKNRFKSGLVGYEVSDEELAALAKEIDAENKRDGLLYILDMLTTILASEQSPALLTRLFNLWGTIVDSLLRGGKWVTLEHVFSLLYETDAVRPNLSEGHKQQVTALLDGLGRPERIKVVEGYLNSTPEANTEGLSTVLLLMKTKAAPGLCSLLANLQSPTHQAIVADALTVLAKDQPEPVLKGLSDRRPAYVRNLLSILMKWKDPKFADSVERLLRYPDAQVRKEVVRAIGLFRPSGNGVKLVSVLGDEDETVRIAALKLLMSGQYSTAFTTWSIVLSTDDFMERPMAERRAVFQAIRATCGDEAVPYWEGLITERAWTNRKKKEELAVMAADALGKLATPAAIATLELGAKKGSAGTRHACTLALAQIQKQQRGNPPASVSA